MNQKKVNKEALKKADEAAERLTNQFTNDLINEVMKHVRAAQDPTLLPVISAKVAGTIVMAMTGAAAVVSGRRGDKLVKVMSKVCPEVLDHAAEVVKEVLQTGQVVVLDLDDIHIPPSNSCH